MIYGIVIFKNTEGTVDNSFQKLEIRKGGCNMFAI